MVEKLEAELAKLKKTLKRTKAEAEQLADPSQYKEELEAEALRWVLLCAYSVHTLCLLCALVPLYYYVSAVCTLIWCLESC